MKRLNRRAISRPLHLSACAPSHRVQLSSYNKSRPTVRNGVLTNRPLLHVLFAFFNYHVAEYSQYTKTSRNKASSDHCRYSCLLAFDTPKAGRRQYDQTERVQGRPITTIIWRIQRHQHVKHKCPKTHNRDSQFYTPHQQRAHHYIQQKKTHTPRKMVRARCTESSTFPANQPCLEREQEKKNTKKMKNTAYTPSPRDTVCIVRSANGPHLFSYMCIHYVLSATKIDHMRRSCLHC